MSQCKKYQRNSVTVIVMEHHVSILLLLLLLLPSYSVQEEQCREVRGVERMKEVDKLGTVDCIDGRESATGEDA